MNKSIYRLVWNRSLGALQVVSELARSKPCAGNSTGAGAGQRRGAHAAGPLALLALSISAGAMAVPVVTVVTTGAASGSGSLSDILGAQNDNSASYASFASGVSLADLSATAAITTFTQITASNGAVTLSNGALTGALRSSAITAGSSQIVGGALALTGPITANIAGVFTGSTGSGGVSGSNGSSAPSASQPGGSGTLGADGTDGGAAVSAQQATLSNGATINGGDAGAGGNGGVGGAGAYSTSGTGSDGGSGASGGQGGVGGTGFSATNLLLTNAAAVMGGRGGNGGSGNVGGQGADAYSNVSSDLRSGSGGNGGNGGAAGAGGTAIMLVDSQLDNSANLTGGAGGNGGGGAMGGTSGYAEQYGYSNSTGTRTLHGGDGGTGGTGGAGASGGAGLLASASIVSNSATIAGGAGGAGGTGGGGGNTNNLWLEDYSNINSTANSSGLYGGSSGSGGSGGVGGVGGSGLSGTEIQMLNLGTLTGGTGGRGGDGDGGAAGYASYVYYESYYASNNTLTVIGVGASGGNGAAGASGGAGGSGATIGASALTNASAMTGGTGGDGGTGAVGANGSDYYFDNYTGSNTNLSGNSHATGGGGNGGDGGNGGTGGSAIVANASQISNTGTLTGGAGGNGGNAGNGGNGGYGYVYDGGSTTASTVSSGNGGNGGNAGSGGNGGDAMVANGSQITNIGSIIGGNGGTAGTFGAGGQPGSLYSYSNAIYNPGTVGVAGSSGIGGQGGVGVRGTGNTTLFNAGTIAGGFAEGGNGVQANAIEFTGGGNTLVLEQGSLIQGNVVSLNGGDTLALGGDVSASTGNPFDLASVGAQYQGFDSYSKEGQSTWLLQGIDSLGETWNVNAGTLVLDQSTQLLGNVNVNAGTFVLDQDANVAGTVSVAAGASLSTATASIGGALINQGNLTVGVGSSASNTLTTGTYNQGSSGTLTVRALSSSVFDKLVVNGTATLGGTLAVDARAGNTLAIGNSLSPVISAAAVSGQFAAVTDNSLLFNFTPVYTANSVGLQLVAAATVTPVAPSTPVSPTTPISPSTPATPLTTVASLQANSNFYGLRAARVLDRTFASNPTGRLASYFVPLTTSAQVSSAVNQSLPTPGTSTAAAGAALNSVQQVVQARSDAIRGISSGESFMTDGHLWLKPFGSWARQDGSNGSADLKASVGGLAIGVDGKRNDYLTLGTAFVYANVNSHTTGDAPRQTLDTDVFQLVGYGTYQLDPITALNFQVDAGQNRNDGKRDISFANLQAKSHYSSWTAHAGTSLDRTYSLAPQTRFTPSVRADYTWIKDNAYNEKGADALNLQANKRSTDSFIVGIDGKLAHDLSNKVSLSVNAGVGYDLIADRDSITTAYAGAPGAGFTTYGNQAQHWVGRGGAGATYKVSDRVDLGVRYDLEARKNFSNQTASAEVRWAF